jgi:hypothetical protein
MFSTGCDDMSSVTISRTATKISVRSPYNSLFVEGAKKLKGKFKDKIWTFDIRDDERVINLCRDVYGSDGITSDTCTIRISMPNGMIQRYSDISIHGITLAKAREWPFRAKTADGVILLEGGFSSEGDSKRWETVAEKGTVILLRDFPRHAAEKYIQEPPHGWTVSIEDESRPVDVAGLMAEKERLILRLDEIEALIASASTSQSKPPSSSFQEN